MVSALLSLRLLGSSRPALYCLFSLLLTAFHFEEFFFLFEKLSLSKRFWTWKETNTAISAEWGLQVALESTLLRNMQASNGHEKYFKVEKKSYEKRLKAYPGIIIRQSAFFLALLKRQLLQFVVGDSQECCSTGMFHFTRHLLRLQVKTIFVNSSRRICL